MSNAFEDVVRPFTSRDVAPPRQYYDQNQPSVPPVIVRAGRAGQGKTFNGSFSVHISSYMTKYVNEQKTATFGTQF